MRPRGENSRTFTPENAGWPLGAWTTHDTWAKLCETLGGAWCASVKPGMCLSAPAMCWSRASRVLVQANPVRTWMSGSQARASRARRAGSLGSLAPGTLVIGIDDGGGRGVLRLRAVTGEHREVVGPADAVAFAHLRRGDAGVLERDADAVGLLAEVDLDAAGAGGETGVHLVFLVAPREDGQRHGRERLDAADGDRADG